MTDKITRKPKNRAQRRREAKSEVVTVRDGEFDNLTLDQKKVMAFDLGVEISEVQQQIGTLPLIQKANALRQKAQRLGGAIQVDIDKEKK